MGSVQTEVECLNCNNNAYNDFYYKTGEELIVCSHCGYFYSRFFKRNEDGKLITKDGTTNFDFDNLIIEEKEIKTPFGHYTIKRYDDIGYSCGTIETENQYNTLVETVSKEDNVESITISRLIDDEIKQEVIVDNGPKVDGSGFTKEDN
jgi:hypothetical protein